MLGAEMVATRVEALEVGGNCRVVDRLFAFVLDQVLLTDVRDVALLRILREQVIEGLVLRRADLLGNRLIPFVAIGEDGVDVEDHAAKIEQSVLHDIANAEASLAHGGKGGSGVHGGETLNVRHGFNLSIARHSTRRLGKAGRRC